MAHARAFEIERILAVPISPGTAVTLSGPLELRSRNIRRTIGDINNEAKLGGAAFFKASQVARLQGPSALSHAQSFSLCHRLRVGGNSWQAHSKSTPWRLP